MSRYRNAGLRLHAYVDQAGHGQIAPAAGRVLRLGALMIHSLEQLQGLEALAHRVLPEPIGLIGTQVAAGDAAAQVLGLARQLAVRLGLDHLQQQPVGLVAVLLWIQLQQRLGQVVGGDQVVRCRRQRLAEARRC